MLKNLKILRQEKGLSQKSFGDRFGLSQQSINKYENHNVEPDIETLKQMADFFDTSIDYLVGHTDERRRIQAVEEHALTQEELIFLRKYRALPENFRETIRRLIEELPKNPY